jgi:Protein of unknown function (DUF3551)
MRRLLMAALAISAVMSFGGQASQAEEAPWCAVTDVGTGNVYWDCRFYSLEACRPYVISGNRGFCNPNPRYHGHGYRSAPHGYRR